MNGTELPDSYRPIWESASERAMRHRLEQVLAAFDTLAERVARLEELVNGDGK